MPSAPKKQYLQHRQDTETPHKHGIYRVGVINGLEVQFFITIFYKNFHNLLTYVEQHAVWCVDNVCLHKNKALFLIM